MKKTLLTAVIITLFIANTERVKGSAKSIVQVNEQTVGYNYAALILRGIDNNPSMISELRFINVTFEENAFLNIFLKSSCSISCENCRALRVEVDQAILKNSGIFFRQEDPKDHSFNIFNYNDYTEEELLSADELSPVTDSDDTAPKNGNKSPVPIELGNSPTLPDED